MSNYFNNKPFKPTKVGVIKAIGQKIGSLIKGKGKVSPTIKSVKPNLKKTAKQTRSEEYSKRIKSLSGSEKKIETGKKMMQEGQKERKKMVDTGRAFQFKYSKSYHPLKPGDKDKYKSEMKVAGPQKKFKTGKELEREKKMGGGMMGRRMGYSQGSKKGKIPTTPKEKSLAKLAPPKDRITFGDVVAGRTKGKA